MDSVIFQANVLGMLAYIVPAMLLFFEMIKKVEDKLVERKLYIACGVGVGFGTIADIIMILGGDRPPFRRHRICCDDAGHTIHHVNLHVYWRQPEYLQVRTCRSILFGRFRSVFWRFRRVLEIVDDRCAIPRSRNRRSPVDRWFRLGYRPILWRSRDVDSLWNCAW